MVSNAMHAMHGNCLKEISFSFVTSHYLIYASCQCFTHFWVQLGGPKALQILTMRYLNSFKRFWDTLYMSSETKLLTLNYSIQKPHLNTSNLRAFGPHDLSGLKPPFWVCNLYESNYTQDEYTCSRLLLSFK